MTVTLPITAPDYKTVNDCVAVKLPIAACSCDKCQRWTEPKQVVLVWMSGSCQSSRFVTLAVGRNQASQVRAELVVVAADRAVALRPWCLLLSAATLKVATPPVT